MNGTFSSFAEGVGWWWWLVGCVAGAADVGLGGSFIKVNSYEIWAAWQVPLIGGSGDHRISEGCLEQVLSICPRHADVRLAEFAWQMLNELFVGTPRPCRPNAWVLGLGFRVFLWPADPSTAHADCPVLPLPVWARACVPSLPASLSMRLGIGTCRQISPSTHADSVGHGCYGRAPLPTASKSPASGTPGCMKSDERCDVEVEI